MQKNGGSGSKKNMPFQFFFICQLSKCHSAVVLLGDKCCQLGDASAKQNYFSPDMKTTTCSLVLNESVLLFFHQGFRQGEMNLLMYWLDLQDKGLSHKHCGCLNTEHIG
ncbi:hypothetical protein AMECASPLE_024229 [Ameca splendens]|uniref:Uncharacterized protein n=1 Tax=Ameca splendens TaxID=208324 RepID=A0ABV1A219_9TELE